MKSSVLRTLLCLALSTASYSFAQTADLRPNQTAGFGAGRLLRFTYTQNFDCVEQPLNDLNFNGKPAQKDSVELQIPICQAGFNPTINPPGMKGRATTTTDPLYVLIPMFSANHDLNPDHAISCTGTVPGTLCGPALGRALISLFGFLPEAFKKSPAVAVQCPDPGSRPGTCTMHASRVDLAPVLAALGFIPKPATMNVFVPTPNHSHVLDDEDIVKPAEWWQVLPVLVLNKNDWPSRDGSKGITSAQALDAAEKAKRAIEAPSNFFLFFSSHGF